MHIEPTIGLPLERAHNRQRTYDVATWLGALLLAALALVPRTFGLADFFTIDEADHWIRRVRAFADALNGQNWVATNQTGHPGVTTMWLGGIGHRIALARGMTPSVDSADYLALLRLPVAVTNSLAVALGYLLLRRIVRPSVALLAAILWATEPFLIAHSRLLHVDGLTTSFGTLSVLLLLLAAPFARSPLTGSGRWVGIALSGVCTGLALLSKVSALVLLAWSGLFLAAIILIEHERLVAGEPRWWRSGRWWVAAVRRVFGEYALWLGCVALTMFVVWPAMWVEPYTAVLNMVDEAIFNGGEPHAWGNYFLGQSIPDPGPLFYPVAVIWRTAPLTLLGLLALPLVFWKRRSTRDDESRTTGDEQQTDAGTDGHASERLVCLALLSWVLLFGLAVTIGAKKFDRYALPIWPALDILAAAGLLAFVGWLGRRVWRKPAAARSALRPATRAVIAVALSALLLAYDLWYQPYYLAYFNPLLGGGAVAQELVIVGWGEGMENVGAWLSARPDRDRGFVLSWIPDTLQPFLPREVRALDIRATTINKRNPAPNYAVIYARGAMREDTPDLAIDVSQTQPLFHLRLYGLDYATIYQLPRPYDTALGARFGDGLELHGFSQQLTASTLVITPSWGVDMDQKGGIFSFVHVLAEDGHRVAQIDASVDDNMFPQWQAGQQFGTALPLQLPPDLPAGKYRVILGVYDAASGARLPLSVTPGLPPDVDGPNALLVTTVTVP